MSTRIMFHKAARDAKALAQIPPCTPEECWSTETTWAVKVPKRKTAVRVFASREEAEEFAADTKDSFLEYRPGYRRRCADYCDGSEFCPAWARYKQENQGSY
jgi:hypothetical protein